MLFQFCYSNQNKDNTWKLKLRTKCLFCTGRQTVKDFANHLKATMIDTLVGATADSETGAQCKFFFVGRFFIQLV